MKIQNQEALKRVQEVIDDADKAALNNKPGRTDDSLIGDTVAGAVGAGRSMTKATDKD